ncbi:MAG TPA: PAS domain S-box protein, partial [Armatimonadota bacterium]|nr:PAS domain S-box protein [Armatimonadota bacterium]
MSEQILAELRKTKESLEAERARLRAVERALEASATQREQAEQRAARAEEKCRVFEAAFQEGEAIDRALMATAPDAIVLCDLDTRILKVNPQGARLAGYEAPAQLEGKCCLDFLEPEDRERAFSGIREALASGFCKYQRYQLRRVDGMSIPVELYATILRDPAGAPQSLLAIIKDISAHMRTEKALTQAVNQWQVTFDAISDAITLLDPNGRVTQCNRALKEMLGLSFHEIIGKHCFELLHRLPHPITDCPLQRMRQSRHSESNVVEVNGRWLQVRVDPVLDAEGHLLGGVHILSDITERKRGEDSLRRLAAIVDSSQDAILGKDLNGTVLSWNAGAERIYGYSAAEMVGKNVSLLLPPECSDELPSLLERIRRGERVETCETLRMRRDGRQIDVSLTISPIKDDTGVVIGASTIVRDITAQKWAQERIRFQASLLDQVRNAVIATDMDGKIIYWNHFAETLYQWKAAEVTGKLHTIIVAAKSLPVVKETLSVTCATGHWEGALQSQRKDGSLFPAYLVQTL